MKNTVYRFLAGTTTMIVCALMVHAQQNVGTIVGTVTDTTGAIVPSAKVVIVNQGTQVTRETQTNSSGFYAFNSLPVGQYNLTVSYTGFQTYVRNDIPVVSGETVTIDVKLVVGQLTQTVNVTAAPPVLDTSAATTATSRTNREIQTLPITLYGNSARSAIALAKTFAGVSYDPAESGGQEFMIMGRAMINGVPDGEWSYNIDGVDGAVGTGEREHDMQAPTPDIIQEVRVTANSDVSEPFNPGVSVNLTEKSGTNDLHGSLYEYHRNAAVGARQWFLKDRPQDIQNNLGFAIGGPVVIPKVYNGRNKTFFFVNWDVYRLRTTLSGVQAAIFASVATPFMRQGNFSELLGPQVGTDASGRPVFQGQIYDPRTTRALPGGGFIRDPFPGNIITDTSRLSPVSLAVIGQEAPPTLPGVANNWFGPNAQTRVDKDQLFMKFDQIINPNHRFTFAYERLTPWTLFQDQGVTTGLSGHSFINGGPGFLPSSGGMSAAFIDDRDQYRYRFNYVWTVKPNMLLSFRAGIAGNPNRVISWFPLTGKTATFGRDIGLKGTLDSRNPLVNIQGFNSMGSTFSNRVIPTQNFPANLDVSWTKGRHNIKFGVNYDLLHAMTVDHSNGWGTFNFLRVETGLPGFPQTGSGMASFMLGEVDNANVSSPFDQYGITGGWGFYGQDTWRVTPKLTLTYGVRWDIFKPSYEHLDRIGTFDPNLPNPKAGGRLGALSIYGKGPGRNGLSRVNETYYGAWGGQLGIAYALNPKTVLRANYGIAYSAAWVKWTGSADPAFPALGFSASLTSSSVDGGVTPAFNWTNGFPLSFPQFPVTDPSLQNGGPLGLINRADNRPPMYENVGFEVGRELPGEIALRVSYVGTFVHRIPTTGLDNLNVLPLSGYQLGSLLTQNINSAAARAAGIPTPFPGFNGSVAQALLPFPQYTSVQVLRTPDGNSNYNAVQVNAQKRVGHGLTFLAAYAAEKTLTNVNKVVIGAAFSNPLQHPALKNTAKALAREDRPQMLSLSWTYDLPFGKGKRFAGNAGGVLNQIIGGWQLSGVQNYFSGRPIIVSSQATIPFAGAAVTAVWPVRQPGVPFSTDSCQNYDPGNPASRYLNKNAFRRADQFTFGNIAVLPNTRQCTYKEEDFGIDKQFQIKEHTRIRFGSLFQNAFNHHIWRGLTTDIDNPAFGRYADAYPGRNIQFYLRVEF